MHSLLPSSLLLLSLPLLSLPSSLQVSVPMPTPTPMALLALLLLLLLVWKLVVFWLPRARRKPSPRRTPPPCQQSERAQAWPRGQPSVRHHLPVPPHAFARQPVGCRDLHPRA
jgi:hypothetical protein